MSNTRSSRPCCSTTNGTEGMCASGKLVMGSGRLRRGELGEYVIDEAELLGLVGGEVAVALRLRLDHLDRFAGVPGQDLVEPGLVTEELLHLDLDVRGLPVHRPAAGVR